MTQLRFVLCLIAAALWACLAVVTRAAKLLDNPRADVFGGAPWGRREEWPAMAAAAAELHEERTAIDRQRRPHLHRILGLTEEILVLFRAQPTSESIPVAKLHAAIEWRPTDPRDEQERLELLFTALGLLDGEGLVFQRLVEGGAGTCVVITNTGRDLVTADGVAGR